MEICELSLIEELVCELDPPEELAEELESKELEDDVEGQAP